MEYKITQATLADSKQLYSLVERFATSFSPKRAAFNHSLEHLLSDNSVLIDVAVFEENIVGYCLAFDHYAFYANGRVTWVEEIMVPNDFRLRGIDRDLMKAVEPWAVLRESRLIALATRRAAPFYKALGYEESAVFFRKMLEQEVSHGNPPVQR